MALNVKAPILTPTEAAEWDRETAAAGLPPLTLMAMAAQAVFDALKTQPWFTSDADFQLLTGPGNNGGDGYVLAWLLAGIAAKPVRVFPYALPTTQEAQFYYQLCLKHPNILLLPWENFKPTEVTHKSILIDAIFGSGFNRQLPTPLSNLFAQLNHSPAKRVALDIPSGIWGDGSAFQSPPFPADLTITIGSYKPGLLLPPGILHCGQVQLVPTGFVPAPSLPRRLAQPTTIPPLRVKGGHKYSSGVLHLLGGSQGMEGACVLAARAFLNTGGGLCRWYTTSANALSQLANLPEIMVKQEPHFSELTTRLIQDLKASRKPLLAMGMGLAEEPSAIFWQQLFQIPNLLLVVDASLLHTLRHHEKVIAKRPNAVTMVLTPHAREAVALYGKEIVNVREATLELAKRYQALVYYKGPGGLLATPEGEEIYFRSQQFALATGGTGDILSGLIANYLLRFPNLPQLAVEQAVLCQLLAASLAEHPESLTASQLLELCRRQHAILQQNTY